MVATLLSTIGSVLFAVISITSAQDACKTPDNWDGKCIVLQECRPLFQLLHLQGQGLTPEQRTFLSRSQCGRNGRNVLVCCPNTFTIADLTGKDCGTHVEDKIVNGERAGLTEFPWLTLLHYKKPERSIGLKSGFFCGGSLIQESYVLTAAHCIRSAIVLRRQYTLDLVRLGENDQKSNLDCDAEGDCADPVQDIPVAELIVHESYDAFSRTQANDIALIRLQRPATLTNYIRPVCLPFLDLQNKNHDGLPLTVAGFGRTENASRSEVKLKLQVNGFNQAECVNTYQTIGLPLSNNILCAGGEEGKDSCTGDSGGPLVAAMETKDSGSYPYLVGIVSIGPSNCGTPGLPGIYTRVDKYLEWILDHMKK